MATDLRVEGISYLVCATQRSGSTLLCELLGGDRRAAGVPDEYFESLRETGLPRQPGQYFEDLSVHGIAERVTPTVPGRPEQPGTGIAGSATCSSGGPLPMVSSAPR